MTTTKRQTAANNELLAAIKGIFNKEIFKTATQKMNILGEADTVEFVAQFMRCAGEVTAQTLIQMAADFREE